MKLIHVGSRQIIIGKPMKISYSVSSRTENAYAPPNLACLPVSYSRPRDIF